MSAKAAASVIRLLQTKPDAVLGLATGSTPLGLYRLLVAAYVDGKIDFSGVTTFNLDEYIGLPAEHPQSYHAYMHTHLFRHINIQPEQTHIPNGTADDPDVECRRYETLISSSNGIDLQLLGLGENGHIGFNEPGADPYGRTHVTKLTESTRKANARFFNHAEEVPRYAITMGLGSILAHSKRILLLAAGEHKAEAVYRMLEEKVTNHCPASYLQTHPMTEIVIDLGAASLLSLSRKKQQQLVPEILEKPLTPPSRRRLPEGLK